MRHIHTKLMLSLLVVSLIPVVPSYYVVKELVNKSIEVGFNPTVESAIEGAAEISRDLYGRYKEETLELAIGLAAADRVTQLFKSDPFPPSEEANALDFSRELGTYRVDIYDSQANLISSSTNIEEETGQAIEPVIDPEDYDVYLDDEARELVALLTGVGDDLPSELSRKKLKELSQKMEAEALEESDDPRRASVFAPVVIDGKHLGFIVVVKVLEKDFGRFARRIVGVNRMFKMLDFHKDEIRLLFLALFLFFYISMAALSVGVGYVFSRRFTSPLLRLVKGTQTVAAGDLDYRIEVSSRDEIGQLMQAFNQMVANIKVNQRLARDRELERQRIEEENRRRVKDLELSELRGRALQAENERQTIELEKTQELERAYQELEESHRQLQEAQSQLILQGKMASLGSMVAGVAHEINNPIGVVHSAVDVSNRCVDRIEAWMTANPAFAEAKNGGALQQAVDILKENVRVTRDAEQRITTLVQSLKNFARLDEAEFQMADLCAGLDDTLNLLQQQFGTDIEMQKEYGEISQTYCSPGQLNQVFMSVLKNAVQAIEGSGLIALRVFQEEREIFVKIRDTGVGISSERLENIFDLGFSAKSSRVKMSSGLSMAYRIVQEHGGEIEVTSEVGEGTEVAIRLPVKEGRQA